jgi:hypothetical protein
MMEKNSETVEELSPWSSASSANNEHPSPISKRNTHKEVLGDTSDWTNSEKGSAPVLSCSSSEQPSHSVQPESLRQKLEQLKSDQELDQEIEQLEQELAQEKEPDYQPETEPKLEPKEDSDVGHEQQTSKIPVLQLVSQPAAASPRHLSREPESSGKLSCDSDDLYNATPVATSNPYSVLFQRRLSDEETGKGFTDESIGQQVDITPEQEKEYEQSETSAQPASFVSSANSPIRDDNGKQNKDTNQALGPSPTSSSNGSGGTVIQQKPSHNNEPDDAPATNYKGPSPLSSPEEGRRASASTSTSISGSSSAPKTAINPQAPLFVTMNEAADERFRPFIEEAAPIPGEHMADTMTRDQIRRCEVQFERPLTDQEKEVIRAYYRDMRQRRAPDEASIPTTIYSITGQPLNQTGSESSHTSMSIDGDYSNDNTQAAAAAAHQPLPRTNDRRATGPTLDTSTQEYFHGIASKLEKKVKALERTVKETTNQRIADGFKLDGACQQISQLGQQKHAIGQQLMTIAQELRAAKAELGKLQADGGVTRRAGRTGGFAWLTLALAMVVLVWLVTEAMLHSKRLSDGFGPYINGGYNGLGSVLIFGSWSKFLVFFGGQSSFLTDPIWQMR